MVSCVVVQCSLERCFDNVEDRKVSNWTSVEVVIDRGFDDGMERCSRTFLWARVVQCRPYKPSRFAYFFE
jgi:hypothetical protein